MNVIELQNVTKTYGAVQALRGVDLTVRMGEVVGFLGPNGAGKSSLIQIMLGLRQPTSGTVRIFGHAPRDAQVRSRIGVMLQESGVPHSLKVEETVRLFQSYYPYTLPTDMILQRAGLVEKRNSLIGDLSGGQKQRLYFALAITGDPDLLFLDEPTVAMDVESRHAFWEQIRGFAALGKTILFSTHHLAEADALASRIVVIQSGLIVAQGSPQEIKGLVATTQVRLRTDWEPAQARTHADVRGARQDGKHLILVTTAPEALLRWLFSEGYRVEDLSVQRADLEEAFLSLTHQESQ
jgi:ABC-2 type transport system ATP-binding protein